MESNRVSKVTCLGRKIYTTFPQSDKLKQVQVDFMNLDALLKENDLDLQHDIAICTLGTTRADAGSDEAFRLVDYTYVANFAQFALKHCGVTHFHLLTSMGSDKNSWFLYPRTKGQIEAFVSDLGFKHTSIYRPGLLDRGSDARTVEKIASFVASALSVDVLGKKIVANALSSWAKPVTGTTILESSHISQLIFPEL
uniref:NAD(P)-binding domain-containing protein n=1 Tax=Arcella intermedia TaxID=1963864 RepID=A0A6B2LHD6_9EUKA